MFLHSALKFSQSVALRRGVSARWYRSSALLNASSSSPSVSTTSISSSDISLDQKEKWRAYLASGRGSKALFDSIDTNHSNTISSKELRIFLELVNWKGINPKAVKILHELLDDHSVDLKEFQSWLVMSTKFSDMKNSDIKRYYEEHPEIGKRYESKYGDEYSWNEVTMSQSLRRMQYAVRGTVVMAADKLRAQGREILFTNIGNPQAVGQKPITYYRQVLALCDLPAENGVDHPNVEVLFPKDVIGAANEIRAAIGSSGTGACEFELSAVL